MAKTVVFVLSATLLGCAICCRAPSPDHVRVGSLSPSEAADVRAITKCDGPAEPLQFTRRLKLLRANHSGIWSRGLYSGVTFTWSTNDSADSVIKAFEKEAHPTSGEREGNRGIWTRQVGRIRQVWQIYLEDGRTGKPGSTTVVLLENFDRDPGAPLPARWNRQAIQPDPPAPLIEVPFLKSRKADEVEIVSFDELFNPHWGPVADRKGTDRDGRRYLVYLDRDIEGVKREADDWAKANGFQKTRRGSYFRAGSGCFEFEVVKEVMQPHGQITAVIMYASDRSASQPIYFGPTS